MASGSSKTSDNKSFGSLAMELVDGKESKCTWIGLMPSIGLFGAQDFSFARPHEWKIQGGPWLIGLLRRLRAGLDLPFGYGSMKYARGACKRTNCRW